MNQLQKYNSKSIDKMKFNRESIWCVVDVDCVVSCCVVLYCMLNVEKCILSPT